MKMKLAITALLIQSVCSFFINEYDPANGIIEIYHLGPHLLDAHITAFDQNYAKLNSYQIDKTNGLFETFPVSIQPNPPEQILFVITFGQVTDYNSIDPSKVHDSFVYIPTNIVNSVFDDKAPEWAGFVPYYADGPSISRCSVLPKNPGSFFTSFATIGAQNNCDDLFPDPTLGGDPHFIQTIKDRITNETVNICYDVSGKSQQSIFILQDLQSKIKVEGVLLDDYYLHKVKINVKGYNLEVNINSLSYKNKMYDWIKNSVIVLDSIVVKIKSDKVSVEINDKDQVDMIVHIYKSVNNFGVYHLDVSFGELKLNKRYGGIIGDVSQKEISIIKEAQSSNQVTIKINNMIARGQLEKRVDKNCILMQVKDLIKPKLISNYIY